MRTAADVRREKDAERAGMSAADVKRSIAARKAERKARAKQEREAMAAFRKAYADKARRERAAPLDGEPNETNRLAWETARITSK